MGKLFESGDRTTKKPRPILVELKNQEHRNKILRKAKTLYDHKEWKGVYINRDMTAREREEEYQLRKELREKRLKGETNLVIKNGKIIMREGNPREKSLSTDGIQNSPGNEQDSKNGNGDEDIQQSQ